MQGSTQFFYDKENDNLIVSVPMFSQESGNQTVAGVCLVSRSTAYIDQNLVFFRAVQIIGLLLIYIIVITAAVLYSSRFVRPLKRLSVSISGSDGRWGGETDAEGGLPRTWRSRKSCRLLWRKWQLSTNPVRNLSPMCPMSSKTPLTSMKVLADSLNGQEDVPVELYREFMTDIGSEIERENKIINDLLSLVKMDKSAGTVNITKMNMNDVLELILKRLRPIAEKQHVELVLETFRPVTAEIDEVKFTLAISNLVENAIKYNREGGWVHVSINADHQYCYIKVEDSGIGIPEDSLTIFSTGSIGWINPTQRNRRYGSGTGHYQKRNPSAPRSYQGT